MKARQNDFVVSDLGALARLRREEGGGWLTWGGGFIGSVELAKYWRILTVQDGLEFYRTHGREIEPPEPETELVLWHQAPGRKLAKDGQRVTNVRRHEDGDTWYYLSNGNWHHHHKSDTIEVLVDE